MADKNLRVEVALGGVNNLSRPLNAAQKSSIALAKKLAETKLQAKNLSAAAANFDKLSAAVATSAAKLSQMREKAQTLANTVNAASAPTQKQTAALQRQQAALEKLDFAQRQRKVNLDNTRQSLARHGILLDRNRLATEQITGRSAQYNQQLALQERQLRRVSAAQKQYHAGQNLRRAMTSGGMTALAGGAGALYASKRLLTPGMDFAATMSKVQAVTRLNQDAPQLAMLEAEAKKLGASTHFSASEAASGQKMLAMAGFTPEAIQQALPGVLNMALAGDVALGAAADIGSNILTQFSLPSAQMDSVSDVLTGTFTRTNTTLQELAETMKYAGPVGAELGISLETLAAMAGKLADGGLKAGMAGTALRASFSRLAGPTAVTQKALDELGISVTDIAGAQKAMNNLGISATDSAGKMRPITQILGDLYRQSQKFSQVERVALFKKIAGEEAFVGLQALVKAAGSGSLQKLIGELEHAGGEASKNAAVMSNNLAGDVKSLGSAWEAVRIDLEKSIDSPLRALAQQFTGALRGAADWIKAHPGLTKALVGSALAAAALAAAAGGLLLVLAPLLLPIGALRLGLSMLGINGIGTLLPKLSTLGAVCGKLLPRVSNMSAALFSWRAVAQHGGTGLSALAGRATNMASTVVKASRSAGGSLGRMATNPMSALAGLGKALGWLATSPLRLLGSVGASAFGALGSMIGLVFSPIGLLALAFVAAAVLIFHYWEPIKAFFSGYFSSLAASVKPLGDAFAWLGDIFPGISAGLAKIWHWAVSLFSPLNATSEQLNQATEAGVSFGRIVGGAIRGLLWPLEKLGQGLGWVLEKFGLIPAAAKAAEKIAPPAALMEQNTLRATPLAKTALSAPLLPLAPNATPPLRRQKFIASPLVEQAQKSGLGRITFKKDSGVAPEMDDVDNGDARIQPRRRQNSAAASAAERQGAVVININVHGGNLDEAKLAALVRKELEAIQQQKERRRRSRYDYSPEEGYLF